MLEGREAEFNNITSFIQAALASRSGHMFIVGIPGTGKTSVVNAALEACAKGNHRTIEFNGMTYSRPRRFLPDLAFRLTGKKFRVYSQATTAINAWTESAHPPCLLVIDEIDRFVLPHRTKSRIVKMEAILYSLLEWSQRGLILLGISNTYDLAERMPNRLRSRVTGAFTLFHAYTAEQIAAILRRRYPDRFEPQLLAHLSKKVASTSGDIRLAFALADQLLARTDRANFSHFDAIQALETPREKALRCLPHFQRQLLAALVRHHRFNTEAPLAAALISDVILAQPRHLHDQLQHTLPRALDDLLTIGFLVSLHDHPFRTVSLNSLTAQEIEHSCQT